jgi:hypothetical protein
MKNVTRSSRTIATLLLASVAACTPLPVAEPAGGTAADADTRPLPAATETTASGLFEAMEARLLAGPVNLRYHVTSQGAFEADLEGVVRIDMHRVVLAGEGTFGGAAVSLLLDADPDSMEIHSPGRSATEAIPPHLREALVVGLTRMGVLHNLARLSAGATPDRADGGVREWVVLRDLRPASEAPPAAGLVGVRFDIEVAGSRTAEAVLWIDRETGMPVQREQVVRFPTGEMRVVERYRVADEP